MVQAEKLIDKPSLYFYNYCIMRDEKKHHKIHRYLKLSIENGHFKVGQKIPSELDLAASFGVSRMTARKAIEQLVAENLLFQIPRNGTFVTDHHNKTIIYLEDNIQSQRSSTLLTYTKVLHFSIEKAGDMGQRASKWDGAELLYSFSRERYIKNTLFAYEESFIPCRFMKLDEKILEGSLTQLFAQKNLIISRIEKEYTATVPEADLKKVFKNFSKGALLRVDFLRYLQSGELLESNSVFYNQNECRFIQIIENK